MCSVLFISQALFLKHFRSICLLSHTTFFSSPPLNPLSIGILYSVLVLLPGNNTRCPSCAVCLTRALPLPMGSSQWVEVPVTGAQSKWDRMSTWLLNVNVTTPPLNKSTMGLTGYEMWLISDCDRHLDLSYCDGLATLFGCYGNMFVFMATIIAIFSLNVSQTCNTQLWCVNRQLYGHLEHTLRVAMVTCWFPWQLISQCSLPILPRQPILKCNVIIGHYRVLRKFFGHHGNCCQGNLTVVFFLSLGPKGPPSCQISLQSSCKQQR